MRAVVVARFGESEGNDGEERRRAGGSIGCNLVCWRVYGGGRGGEWDGEEAAVNAEGSEMERRRRWSGWDG